MAVLVLAFAAGCGGSRPEASRPAGPSEPTVRLDWRRQRPYRTPWGDERLLANRKPRWFCATPLDHPENAVCRRTEPECDAAGANLGARPSPGMAQGRIPCEPHARAACAVSLGACYPTIAICESARKLAARDQGSNQTRAMDSGQACTWQDE